MAVGHLATRLCWQATYYSTIEIGTSTVFEKDAPSERLYPLILSVIVPVAPIHDAKSSQRNVVVMRAIAQPHVKLSSSLYVVACNRFSSFVLSGNMTSPPPTRLSLIPKLRSNYWPDITFNSLYLQQKFKELMLIIILEN